MSRSKLRPNDWSGHLAQLAIVWGLPVASMIVTLPFSVGPKTVIWVAALSWMGVACLINASQCGRTHCRFTGPYFIAMAGVSLAHGVGVLPLGSYGWLMIGAMSLLGGALLWWGSEAIFGRYGKTTGE
jgi:hypothetical protein